MLTTGTDFFLNSIWLQVLPCHINMQEEAKTYIRSGHSISARFTPAHHQLEPPGIENHLLCSCYLVNHFWWQSFHVLLWSSTFLTVHLKPRRMKGSITLIVPCICWADGRDRLRKILHRAGTEKQTAQGNFLHKDKTKGESSRKGSSPFHRTARQLLLTKNSTQ